jgi:serine/threonine protein kinase
MPELIRKIEPGDVIGRCRTIRELGRGGVGTVYLATHQTLQIEVAIKVLSPSLSIDNPALAERFIREAQLAARIRHPNVIAVMDAAQDEPTGLYYIVMEYVGGGSLSWHLRHGPLPEAKCVAIVIDIAHALALAEENRVVHRDIKPDNIMLDLRGTAKLADLGLAKHAIDSRTSITLGGSFMGTPAYMSPEQARDAKVADTRDDIYSLGATFFECLTGQPPFQGETPYNIMSELLTKPSPSPRALRPEISRSADLICRKMMAKTRDLRYADTRALLHDLQHCQACGDSGLDRLEAAHFDHESHVARQEALRYGVETSVDGVALVPEPPDDSEASLISKPAPALLAPHRADYAVFAVAALLVALVTAGTLAVAWREGHHPLVYLKNLAASVYGRPASTQPGESTGGPSSPSTSPETVAQQPPPEAPTQNPSADNSPPIPIQPVPTPVPPSVVTPPALPANAADATNSIPAIPVPPEGPIPATQAVPDSAFIARSIAENSLDAGTVSPTGHAELLKIVGKRDPTQITPTAWTFYFYDKSAAGNARIITVSDGKLVKAGEDFVDFASPYQEQDILSEDKVQKDSTDILQIAESLVPGVTISSAEFVLSQQKNSIPLWKVTLWNKNPDGGEHKLGDVTIVAENGFPISKNLKP